VSIEQPNKECVGCRWNSYPLCRGNIVDGEFMQIDKLRAGFKCGTKGSDDPSTTYINTPNPKDQRIKNLEDKNIELEATIQAIEAEIETLKEK